MSELILFNKPFRVLSQFTDRDNLENPRATLSDYLDAPGYRAAGRLDYDSEGLLLLTDDGTLQQQIANPRHKQWKTYWVQVEGEIDMLACEALSKGVALKDGLTRPARAKPITPPSVWPRDPPIRVRQTVADSWLELAVREGKPPGSAHDGRSRLSDSPPDPRRGRAMASGPTAFWRAPPGCALAVAR